MQNDKRQTAPSLGWHFDYDEEYAMACAIKDSKKFMESYGRPHNFHTSAKTARNDNPQPPKNN